MKFYYVQPECIGYGKEPNLELAKTVRLVPWSEELEAKRDALAIVNDWDNPVMRLMPVFNSATQLSWEFAEVASEAEARELICDEWAKSWFEYCNDL